MPKEPEKENVLVPTAKTIGEAAGKIAALAGAKGGSESAQPQARTSKGRLPKANKDRLPRRQKKAQKAKKKAVAASVNKVLRQTRANSPNRQNNAPKTIHESKCVSDQRTPAQAEIKRPARGILDRIGEINNSFMLCFYY